MSLFGELKRRNVFRVGIAYVLAAWVIVQVADVVLENIEAPIWIIQTTMLFLALGFPAVLLFSWAYEVTPEGIKKESEIDRSESITRVTGRKLNNVITALLVVALGYFVWESRSGDQPVEQATVSGNGESTEVIATDPADLSIAVLPFENRSNREEDQFFVDGMHDDLLTTLAKVGSMKVISRTSVMDYRNQPDKKIPDIARELGVANILEGGVQRAGNHVRINVQLIDANTDQHLWAEIYDRELTVENLFAIQSEISKAIASALHATLSPEEVQRIDAVPTQSLDALDHYLRGRKLMATRIVVDLERATQEFLRAVEIDPDFALAWVGVADSHALLAGYKVLPEGAFDSLRDDAINRALELDPQLGEAYASLGTLKLHQGKFAAAEAAYDSAIRYSPNYSTAYHWRADMLIGHPMRGPEAVVYARRAVELDPNSAIILSNLGDAYLGLGDYENAKRYFTKTIDLYPDFTTALRGFATVLERLGDPLGAIHVRKKMIELDPDNALDAASLAFLYAEIGAIDEATSVYRWMQERLADHSVTLAVGPVIALADGEEFDTRSAITAALETELSTPAAFLLGYSAMIDNEFELAFDAFRRSDPDRLETSEVTPELLNWWIGSLCELSWVLLETEGNEEFGRKLLDASMELHESGFHSDMRKPERFNWSLCYLLRSEHDTALDLLERELDGNFTWNWPWLLSTQPYDSIREQPRFIRMQNEFERRMTEHRELLRKRDEPVIGF